MADSEMFPKGLSQFLADSVLLSCFEHHLQYATAMQKSGGRIAKKKDYIKGFDFSVISACRS